MEGDRRRGGTEGRGGERVAKVKSKKTFKCVCGGGVGGNLKMCTCCILFKYLCTWILFEKAGCQVCFRCFVLLLFGCFCCCLDGVGLPVVVVLLFLGGGSCGGGVVIGGGSYFCLFVCL